MRVLICGDRDWKDEDTIENYIKTLPPRSVVIHGNCRGADRIARRLALKHGHSELPIKAKWGKHGRSAGPRRNREMLDKGKPDIVIAFHDNIEESKGTKDMIDKTRKRGIPYKIIHSWRRGMNYREIPPNRVLKFSGTPGFKGWKDFFTDDSTTHPAKMNLKLLRHILEAHTRPGDVILDPMAGTGSTIVLAAMLGRHGIAVEYEPHFCDMIKENIKRAEKQTTLTTKGSMVCSQGDARELSKLLKDSDVIVTSPPFSLTREGSDRIATGIDVKTGKSLWSKTGSEFSEGNIQKLSHGDIEAIITSPPYGSDNANLMERKDKSAQSVLSTTGVRAVSLEEDNIGVLEYGDVDAIVSSPPYEASVKRGDEGPGASGKDSPTYAERLEQPSVYSNDPENIGNLRSDSYLEAMLQCYSEFYKVLKEGGIMVLVVKNFIRDKAVVRLDLDTIRLAEAVGFTLKDRWYFKLPTRSFWRLLYEQKFPDAPKLLYEDVLIFGK